MRIKVVLLDGDQAYLNRIAGVFLQKYADKIEVCAFSEKEAFEAYVRVNICNIVLCDWRLCVEEELLPESTTLVYLSETAEEDSYKGKRAVGKYQRVSLIYKTILNIVSEKMSNVAFHDSNPNIKTIAFISAQGGTGSTTVASAFCVQKAGLGNSVFYLNLEKLGNTSLYLQGSGNAMSMSDVLFNIKSKKNNIIMKMESALQRDVSGVEFFAPYMNPNDALEMTVDDQEILVKSVANMKEYQYLVVDMDLSLDEKMKQICVDFATEIVLVGDGTKTSNDKIMKLTEILQIWEEKFHADILGKTYLIYNRFSSTKGIKLEGLPVKMLGGVPRYENADYKQVVNQIAGMEVFGEL